MSYQSNFNIIFEQVLTSLINEGGNAFEGLSGIQKQNISNTLNWYKQNVFLPLGIADEYWTAEIGSVGKKDVSGDIDIAVNMEALIQILHVETLNDIKDKICEQLDKAGIENRRIGANILTKVPIQGETQAGEFVQIDLFPSNDLEFAKQRFYAPNSGVSKYKGAHRRMAVSALIKAVSLAIADEAVDEDKQVYVNPDGIEYPGLVFSYITLDNDGFYKVTKTYKGSKPGKILKHAKHLEPKQKVLVTRNWQEILDILFGKDKYTVEDLESFETIWNKILMDPEFPYKDKLNNIIKMLSKEISDDETINMPEEIIEYFNHG